MCEQYQKYLGSFFACFVFLQPLKSSVVAHLGSIDSLKLYLFYVIQLSEWP